MKKNTKKSEVEKRKGIFQLFFQLFQKPMKSRFTGFSQGEKQEKKLEEIGKY